LTRLSSGDIGPDELRKLNQLHPERYPFLLQSTASSGDLGRYDILFAFPGESLFLDGNSELAGWDVGGHDTFLGALDAWWADERTESVERSIPFHGGWFLYLGYELAAEIETSLRLSADPLLPVAFAVRCPTAIIYDHESQSASVVSENEDKSGLTQIDLDIQGLANLADAPQTPIGQIGVSEDEPDSYTEAVVCTELHPGWRHLSRQPVTTVDRHRLWRNEFGTPLRVAVQGQPRAVRGDSVLASHCDHFFIA